MPKPTKPQRVITVSRRDARRVKLLAASGKRETGFEMAVQEPAEKPLRSFHIQPRTRRQQDQLDAIEEDAITVAIGPAGTGKTHISCCKAVQLLSTGDYDQLVLCRANVPTGSSLGHFPGTIEEKLAPWLSPMTSVLKKAMGAARYDLMLRRGQIQMQPLETVRGQSFERTILLVDEAQNLSIEEIKALTTRLGEGSKMVLMGDPNQSDVARGMALLKFADMCLRNDINVPVIRYTVDDIVRSDIVGKLVRMFHTAELG